MKKQNQKKVVLVAAGIFFILLSVKSVVHSSSPINKADKSEITEIEMQSLVMNLADEYITFLGESVYLIMRNDKMDSKGRWLAQSFLRNGVGACLDIAVSPNPSINLLDLLVLTSLQTWSFENHWIPSGIGKAGVPALDRLKHAEAEIWKSAGKRLSKDQLAILRGLINTWISENSDRTVVSLVRFSEFSDERRISSLSQREKANGLLKDVIKMRATVDDAVLLGERLIWFAGRYPYLIGEQTELTAYRLMDQPEGTQIIEGVKSLQKLSDSITEKLKNIDEDIRKQQKFFFTNLSIERKEAIDQFFSDLSKSQRQFLDDIFSREKELLEVMTQIRGTISDSALLADRLTKTVNAIDRLVSHFDVDTDSDQEAIKITDVRDAAIETARAAERITQMLDRTLELMDSRALDRGVGVMSQPLNAIINRAFWLGVILISLFLGGLLLIRITTTRKSDR